MALSDLKSDKCYEQQQLQTNKSIFDYITDDSMFVNTQECSNYTPPFLAYVPKGIVSKNVDAESDLRGITRPSSTCADKKYQAPASLPANVNVPQECPSHFKIRSAYLPRD